MGERIKIEDIKPGDVFVIPRIGIGGTKFIEVVVERTTKTQVITRLGRRWKVGNNCLGEYGGGYHGDIAYPKGGKRHLELIAADEERERVDEMLAAVRIDRYNYRNADTVKQALDVLTEWHARLVAGGGK